MSRSKRRQKEEVKPIAPVPTRRDNVRPWLLAVFVALCVARPLVPSEAVSWLGDGHPFTMLLLVITACYLLLAVQRGGFTRRFHVVDAAVGALVLLCVTSATLGVLATLFGAGNNPEFDDRASSPRLALNMLWEWIGLGLVFFLARQLIATATESRAVVAAMIALAVVLSALGLYQVSVSLPAERAAYAADPDEVLRAAGQWYPPDSPQRARFEDRLHSSEPLATFALANSLAGFLAPWLVVALGVAWNMAEGRPNEGAPESKSARFSAAWMGRIAGMAGCLAAILVCLVLTKSRSAYLAIVVGFVLLPISNDAFRRMLNWRLIVAAGGVLAVVIAAAMLVGGLDVEVLTEASKSLSYRLEYWQATLDMIAQYPLLGVGPGEFQDYYTQFKLPQASEEIRDPHNFLLEVWATGGTAAFLALAVVLAGFVWHTWVPSDSRGDRTATGPGDSFGPKETVALVSAGGGVGMLFAFGVGPIFGFYLSVGHLLAALAIGAAVLAILWNWASTGTLPARLPALGVLVLAVNLLAAGGFTFPGVAGTFWLLMALALNGNEPAVGQQPAAGLMRRLAPAAGLGVAVVAMVACYSTAFWPVISSRALLTEASRAELTERQRMHTLLEATEADPFSAEAWMALAELCVGHLKENPKSEEWGQRFVSASGAIVTLHARSSAAWRQIGHWYREVYEHDPNPDLADRIVQLTRGAAFLYPNSAVIQAEYATALHAVGRTADAKRTAARALELDGLMPHDDKKLPPGLKSQLEQLVETAEPP